MPSRAVLCPTGRRDLCVRYQRDPADDVDRAPRARACRLSGRRPTIVDGDFGTMECRDDGGGRGAGNRHRHWALQVTGEERPKPGRRWDSLSAVGSLASVTQLSQRIAQQARAADPRKCSSRCDRCDHSSRGASNLDRGSVQRAGGRDAEMPAPWQPDDIRSETDQRGRPKRGWADRKTYNDIRDRRIRGD